MIKFAVVCIIFATMSLLSFIYPKISHKMPYIEPSKVLQVEYEQTDYKMSTGEIRHRIEDLVGVNVYWYKESKLDGRVGKSNVHLRRVVIDTNATQSDYIETLCHELLHIKHFTANERFVNYKTFVTLYESEFRQVAINMAWEMQNGKVEREYNCLAQICDYLAQ